MERTADRRSPHFRYDFHISTPSDTRPRPPSLILFSLDPIRLKADSIAEVGVDAQERLYVRPTAATFPYIYREAREVHWDSAVGHLYSPKPREWTYARWFQQIIEAAAAYGQPLRLTASTVWINIPNELKTEVERIMASQSTTPFPNEV